LLRVPDEEPELLPERLVLPVPLPEVEPLVPVISLELELEPLLLFFDLDVLDVPEPIVLDAPAALAISIFNASSVPSLLSKLTFTRVFFMSARPSTLPPAPSTCVALV